MTILHDLNGEVDANPRRFRIAQVSAIIHTPAWERQTDSDDSSPPWSRRSRPRAQSTTRCAPLAVALLDSGSDGLLVAGADWKSLHADATKLRLFSKSPRCRQRGAVIAGTGTYNTAESVEFTREAARTGVDVVLAVTPYYNKPPQGLYRHSPRLPRRRRCHDHVQHQAKPA
jgi:hypothetical protein